MPVLEVVLVDSADVNKMGTGTGICIELNELEIDPKQSMKTYTRLRTIIGFRLNGIVGIVVFCRTRIRILDILINITAPDVQVVSC